MANKPPWPDEPVPAIPIIRNSAHLNRLIDSADSDNHMWAIKNQAEKQGLSTDHPAFEGLKRGGKVKKDLKVTGSKIKSRLDRKKRK